MADITEHLKAIEEALSSEFLRGYEKGTLDAIKDLKRIYGDDPLTDLEHETLLKQIADLKLEIKGVRGTQELAINELQTQREANGKLKKRIEELEAKVKEI